MKNIIFIISLPRSGSTLLQKILMAHKEINSVSEPWILLPLVYNIRSRGVISEYDSRTCYSALKDFISELPGKEQAYYDAVGRMVRGFYNEIAEKNVKYFLDKTPRYYNIIPEIYKIFPEARYIFLFRNPLAILSSVMETWHNGKLKLGHNYRDVYHGPKLIAERYKLLEDKCIKVNYEGLAANPEAELKKIFNYLEINFDNNCLDNFYAQDLKGIMGDKNDNKEITKDKIDNWRNFYSTGLRRNYAKKYLDHLGPEILEIFGYERKEVISELKSPRFDITLAFSDRYNLLKEKIKYFLVKNKILKKIFPYFIYHDR